MQLKQNTVLLVGLFEIKSVVLPDVFKIVGLNTKWRTLAPLEQLQPSNIGNQAPFPYQEMINLKGQTSEAERYSDNSEKLGATSLQIRDQLKISQIEASSGIEKLLQMEGAVEGNKLKIKALKLENEYKKEFSESQRERKKLHANFEAETLAQEQLWKRLRLYDAQSPFSAPPSLFYILLLLELAPSVTVEGQFKSLFF